MLSSLQTQQYARFLSIQIHLFSRNLTLLQSYPAIKILTKHLKLKIKFKNNLDLPRNQHNKAWLSRLLKTTTFEWLAVRLFSMS